MNKPIVSIIIATFNAAKTLKIALDSVLNQTYQDWECIIIDGVSKDNTIEIIKSYTELDNRFRYISEPDNGIYDAFNKGWKIAKGKWIYYLGADDELLSNGLQDLITKDTSNTEMITGDVYVRFDNGELKPRYSYGINCSHQGVLVLRCVLEKLKGFDLKYKILADKDFLIRFENKGYRVKNERVYIALFSLGGISQSLHGTFIKAKENYEIYKNDSNTKFPLIKTCKIFINSLIRIIYRKLMF